MFKNILLIVLVLASATQVASIEAGNVTLKADTGDFLKICANCGSSVQDSASVQPSNGDGTQFWQLELVGDKVAFKGSHGLYLSRCYQCWSGSIFNDAATVHVAAVDANTAYALWTPELLPNGKYHFISDVGGYLARCYGCNSSPVSSNFAFVNTLNASDPQGQWDLTYPNKNTTNFTNPLKPGTVQLLASNAFFLKICHNCGSIDPDSASIQSISDGTHLWQLEVHGNQVAFKGSNGLYLTRCQSCWAGSNVNDSAMVTASVPTGSALWTPQFIPSTGKYALKGDNGLYLAVCMKCNLSPVQFSFAYVNVADSSNGAAQWFIAYRPNPIHGNNTISNLYEGYVSLRRFESVIHVVGICFKCGNGTLSADVAQIAGSLYNTNYNSWQMEVVGSQVAFRSRHNGRYLARCYGCLPGYPDVDATVINSTTLTPQALWTPEYQFNGNYSFKGDNGKYLTYRDPKKAAFTYPVFVNATTPIAEAQWLVIYDIPKQVPTSDLYIKNDIAMPSAGLVKLKADNGMYLMNCTDGKTGFELFCFENTDGPLKQWRLKVNGLKITFDFNGGYLYPSNNNPGRLLVSKIPDASTEWIPFLNSNGKWSFQGRSGGFLMRCPGCSVYKDYNPQEATCLGKLPSDPLAQFTLEYV